MNAALNRVEDITNLLSQEGYISSTEISTILFLALKMERPILVEGPAGVGKTELAKALSKSLQRQLVHLQCYEGLDETKAIYEWEYAKQLLYTQMLKEKINEVIGDKTTIADSVKKLIALEDAFFSEHFLLPRPLLQAITSEERTVLLIDEVDKSDPEFEAYLLEVLSSYQITIPELGTIKAKSVPLVLLTSNNSRDLSDALKRRCLHLYIDFPNAEQEAKIIHSRVGGIEAKLVNRLVDAVHQIRTLDIKKKPSISESIDWADALVSLQVEELSPKVLKDTIGTLSKYKTDADQILANLPTILGAPS